MPDDSTSWYITKKGSICNATKSIINRLQSCKQYSSLAAFYGNNCIIKSNMQSIKLINSYFFPGIRAFSQKNPAD